jgi:hypothetical protein
VSQEKTQEEEQRNTKQTTKERGREEDRKTIKEATSKNPQNEILQQKQIKTQQIT